MPPATTKHIRKNMDMDARKLAQVRKILGTSTDTEAVDRALELVIFQNRVLKGIDRMAAAGGLEDIYAEAGSGHRAHRAGRRAVGAA